MGRSTERSVVIPEPSKQFKLDTSKKSTTLLKLALGRVSLRRFKLVIPAAALSVSG